jgi:hypothetical protein
LPQWSSSVDSLSRIILVSVALSGIQSAVAQALPDRIRSCAAQVDAGARLECYDALAVSIGTSGDKGGAVPPAVPATAETSAPPATETQFGITGSKLQRKKEAATPNRIEAVVSGVARRPRGELVITLDNGQVWAQLAPQEYFPLKIGDEVQIAKAALGSYFMTIPAKRGSKVTRLL